MMPEHTLDLPNKNRTRDAEINAISEREQRIILTKDADFVNTFLVYAKPYKSLLVSTGNITNKELEEIFSNNFEQIIEAFRKHDFVEIDRKNITIHS